LQSSGVVKPPRESNRAIDAIAHYQSFRNSKWRRLPFNPDTDAALLVVRISGKNKHVLLFNAHTADMHLVKHTVISTLPSSSFNVAFVDGF
jgi:hypothetical protein